MTVVFLIRGYIIFACAFKEIFAYSLDGWGECDVFSERFPSGSEHVLRQRAYIREPQA